MRCFPSGHRATQNIENRSWPTNYRGPVLIHASLKIDKQPCVDHGLDPTKLETGGVVGIAKIVYCVTTHRNRWFEGPYGFVLKNRRGSSVCEMDGRFGFEGRARKSWRPTAIGGFHAVLKRQALAAGLKPPNHKRVYRV